MHIGLDPWNPMWNWPSTNNFWSRHHSKMMHLANWIRLHIWNAKDVVEIGRLLGSLSGKCTARLSSKPEGGECCSKILALQGKERLPITCFAMGCYGRYMGFWHGSLVSILLLNRKQTFTVVVDVFSTEQTPIQESYISSFKTWISNRTGAFLFFVLLWHTSHVQVEVR